MSFNVNKGNIKIFGHCYGGICLVGGKNCYEGNVFLNAKPICGPTSEWTQDTEGDTICTWLGFRKAIKVTTEQEYVLD